MVHHENAQKNQVKPTQGREGQGVEQKQLTLTLTVRSGRYGVFS